LAIVGAYGGVNVGDELILHCALSLAKNAGYDASPNVIGGRDRYGEFWDRPGSPSSYISWRSPLRAARAVMGRDLFVGGGQIIDGRAGIRNPATQLGLSLAARLTGGRVGFGGAGAAFLKAGAPRWIYRLCFRIAQHISVRDQSSLEQVTPLVGNAPKKLRLDNDLVFSLYPEALGVVPAAERKILAVAVHHSPDVPLTDFNAACKLVERLRNLKSPEQEIVLVPHDFRPDFDPKMITDIMAKIGSDQLSVRWLKSADDTISFYKTVRTIISVRMHPIILGSCTGSFCVPITETAKLRDMAARVALPTQTFGQLLALSDSEFAAAIGLGVDGPMAGADLLRDLSDGAANAFMSARTLSLR
jgi:polysaccharide pyruvyl transferase WcaK-like protein